MDSTGKEMYQLDVEYSSRADSASHALSKLQEGTLKAIFLRCRQLSARFTADCVSGVRPDRLLWGINLCIEEEQGRSNSERMEILKVNQTMLVSQIDFFQFSDRASPYFSPLSWREKAPQTLINETVHLLHPGEVVGDINAYRLTRWTVNPYSWVIAELSGPLRVVAHIFLGDQPIEFREICGPTIVTVTCDYRSLVFHFWPKLMGLFNLATIGTCSCSMSANWSMSVQACLGNGVATVWTRE